MNQKSYYCPSCFQPSFLSDFQVDEEKIEKYYTTSSSTILAAVLAALFLLFVLVALCVGGKYVNRQKGSYVTREDEGAQDAYDADTAVLQGRTGHQVEKKKEWFI